MNKPAADRETSSAPLPHLEQRIPGMAGCVSRLAFGRFPTAVQPLEELSRRAGARVWVKREDLASPYYGGNKVRKLELIFGDTLRRGARRVVAWGPLGSNYVVAVVIHGRGAGIPVDAVLFRRPLTEHGAKNLRLVREQASHVRETRTLGGTLVRLAMTAAHGDAVGVHVLPMGGSSALSTLGYVEAGLELAAQIQCGACPCPDYAVVAMGTAGTAAGLALGFQLAGLSTRVLGVRVGDLPLTNRFTWARQCRKTADLLSRWSGRDMALNVPHGRLVMEHRFFGRGYAVPSEDSRAARELISECEGIDLEDTYTGKALAGLLAWARKEPRATFMFWNTYSSACRMPAAGEYQEG